MTKKYLSFNEKMSLKLSPSGCEVLCDNSLVMPGNSDLGIFIRSCDGKTTAEEIIKINTDSPEHFKDALSHIGPLIEALVQKDCINISDEPKPVVVNVVVQNGLLPSVVALELTDRCNLKCAYCYQECSPLKESFLQDPLTILAFLKKIDVRGIELTGGEPTMHPQFMQVLRFACANFAMVGLITNGTLLNNEMMEIMKEGSSKHSVQICLDGPDKKTVDATDGIPGAYEKIVQGIKIVKRHGILLRVGMVLDSESKIDMIDDTLQIAKVLGADCFLATPAINFGRARGQNTFSSEFMGKFMQVHQPLKEKYGKFYASESEHIDIKSSTGCGAGHRDITVTPAGLVKICSLQPSAWFNFGHIMDIESPDTQERFCSFSKLPAPSFESCKDCEHLNNCMKCYTRAFNLLITRAIEKDQCKWYKQNMTLLSKFEIH
jgi:radical SAM protein with 4Fe4S-binding SPASM domain